MSKDASQATNDERTANQSSESNERKAIHGGDRMTVRERLRMQLAQALTRSESPVVRAHLRAALRAYGELPPSPLVECPFCGQVGLPERLRVHDCQGSSEDVLRSGQ